ncbi:inositol oxygenase [Aestuariibacter sp. A3R04]|uniref:inositol oxygenase n=1 Tax=Aestuariibacter sp. A3R04 TaxID=2841571 RepID=UPI001C0806BF|nr:inositol oxygenase [Aestuariibacter sp. A3R04]MBU3021215.1 inositol oxygenase [Aestuariibacter sp. A3R04]
MSVLEATTVDPQSSNTDESFGGFRNYEDSAHQDRVQRTYKNMHINQTREFVLENKQKYFALNVAEMHVYEVFKRLESIVDESDPDSDLPQIIHAYQSAESICDYAMGDEHTLRDDLDIESLFTKQTWLALPEQRRAAFKGKNLKAFYPEVEDWSWFPLVGFIHDLGKVMLLPEFGCLPQWAVVGDTYPVGAPFASANVFYSKGFYKKAQDYGMYETDTQTHFGMYSKHCGFDAVDMTWGHDEYIYEVMAKGSEIHPYGLYLLRYHSFYPWHTPQNGEMAYLELASEYDWHLLPLLKAFQKADLYSKSPHLPPLDILERKYTSLMEIHIPKSVIRW